MNSKWGLLICLLLSTIFLTGCFHHCYRGHPYNLCQTDLNLNVKEAFSSNTVLPGEIAYGTWWHFFEDPQLSAFIEMGLNCHPDIKLAEAKIRRACHEAGIARSELFPHIFGIASINRQKISDFAPGFFPGAPDIFTEVTLELRATYELDLWKKNRSLYYSALDQMKSQIADYEEAKLLLSTTIAAFYFDLQMKLARKEIALKRLKTKEELYELHKQQFDLGISSEFRLYQVHTEVQILKELVLVLEGEILIDQHALSALIGNLGCPCGEGNKELLVVEPSAQFHSPFPLPLSLPIDLLNRRPDITARKWLVEAACYDIKAARAHFFPRIDLMSWIGFQSIDLSKLFTYKSLIALGQATATLPLYLAGKLQAQLGVARESLEIAIESYNQSVLNAVQEVSNALSDLMISNQRKISIEGAIMDASALLKLTEEKYEHQIYNKLAVLNARESLYLEQDLELQIQLDRFESAVKLIRAIGGGYNECACL